MEAERKPEPVGQRQLVVDRVARVERIVLLARLARHDRPAVRSDRKPDIGRPRLDPAVEPRAQVPRAGGIAGREAEIVDEHHEASIDGPERGEERRKRRHGVRRDLHKRDPSRLDLLRREHCGADQRRLAHPARPP